MKHNRNKTMSAEIKQNNLLNSPTPNQYSILGGVVAPKSSAYTIQGMSNPLAERPTRVLDTTRPSLRDNSSTSRFNDFNPYNNAPKKSSEVIRNNMQVRSKVGQKVIQLNVNCSEAVNTGNFESVKWNYGGTIELEEGDNYESVKQEWINECAKTINKLSKHTRGLKKLEAIAVKGNPQVNTSIEIIEK